MTYYMKYDIRIGSYKVNTLKSVSVKRSVEQLSDTATIVLPGTLVNEALEVNDKIKRGDAVSIDLGYDGYMNHEFSGYVKSINTDDNDIRIECEDELYLWDVSVQDAQYGDKKSISLKELLQKIALQVNPKYKIECDYSFTYSRFTVSGATAIDVLKKIQDETKANIYFEGNTLHIHPIYGDDSWSGRLVKYDMSINIISADLKYKKSEDQKIRIEVERKMPNGDTLKDAYGPEGGRVVKKVTTSEDRGSLSAIAQSEYNLWCYDGYEGSLTGWLIPFCQPTDRVEIIDHSNLYKKGRYYVIATDVEFSSGGGRRKVTIGRKVQ